MYIAPSCSAASSLPSFAAISKNRTAVSALGLNDDVPLRYSTPIRYRACALFENSRGFSSSSARSKSDHSPSSIYRLASATRSESLPLVTTRLYCPSSGLLRGAGESLAYVSSRISSSVLLISSLRSRLADCGLFPFFSSDSDASNSMSNSLFRSLPGADSAGCGFAGAAGFGSGFAVFCARRFCSARFAESPREPAFSYHWSAAASSFCVPMPCSQQRPASKAACSFSSPACAYSRYASAGSFFTPVPDSYSLPSSSLASFMPASAARRYHLIASTVFLLTPTPWR